MQPKQFTVYIYLLTLRLVFVDTLRYVSLYKTQRQVNISIYDRNHFILRIQVLGTQTLRQVTNDTPLSTYSVHVPQINFNEAVFYTNVNCFYCNLLLNLTQIPIT